MKVPLVAQENALTQAGEDAPALRAATAHVWFEPANARRVVEEEVALPSPLFLVTTDALNEFPTRTVCGVAERLTGI